MSNLAASLKQKINDSGRDLKSVAADAGISYYKLRRWMKTETKSLCIEDFEKLVKHVTGEGVEL